MKIGVVGAGSWGSAMALHLGRCGHLVRLWIREIEIFEQAEKSRENSVFLPGFRFPEGVELTTDLADCVNSAEAVFIAVPSDYCPDLYRQLKAYLKSGQILISMTKGIDRNSLKRMSVLLEEILAFSSPPKIAVLSGPSFAREVAELHPTAVVIASNQLRIAKKIQQVVSNATFRAYTTDDVIGVEIAGALKNVMAISAGIIDGLNFGSNAQAALITRGLHEISRLGIGLGAKKETFAGLAGVGDLVLTCTGSLSRNRHVGTELGKGLSLKAIQEKMTMVAEGVTTTLSAYRLAQREKISMPICEQVYRILYKNKNPKTALQELMNRKLKHESWL